MTLSSWTSVVLFVLFVVPGLLFDLLSRRRRVEVDESAFREAGRVVLASVAFGVPGAVMAYLIWGETTGQRLALGKLLSGDSDYYRDQAEAIFWALINCVACSVVLVAVTNYLLDFLKGTSLTPSHSQWTEVFRFERPAGSRPYVRLRTKSGMWWAGQVIHFTADLEVAGREITLAAPISRGNEEGTLWSCDSEMQRLIFRGDELESLGVLYVPVEEITPPARWKRLLSRIGLAHLLKTDANISAPDQELSSEQFPLAQR